MARMFDQIKQLLSNSLPRFSRRDLFARAGWATAPALLAGSATGAPNAAKALAIGPKIYESIGVTPLINCRGTLTAIGGSLELDAVRNAKEAAALHFVPLDELFDAIGARLAAITGAEWGTVTSGCAAAMSHATAACVAGANPDLHVRIPNLAGFQKDEVIIPKRSRNVYDAAIRAVGVRIVEIDTADDLKAAIGPKTAMIYVFARDGMDRDPLPFETLTAIAQEHKVPVLVDAAAEILTIPNVHLQKGATLVAYSGGKCIRGPQCAGVLLGRKDLVQAAWIHGAPHHGYGRAMKVGKEEAIGMLAAIEAWVKRDHAAEWKTWMSWMSHIASKVQTVEGVTASVREPRGLSNRTPGLTIRWNADKLNITGAELTDILYTTEPRVALAGGGGGRQRDSAGGGDTGISLAAYMMAPGEDKIVADRIHSILSQKRATKPKVAPQQPATNLNGRWDVTIEFTAGVTQHALHLKQEGAQIVGTHQGDFVSRDLSGRIEGDKVTMRSSYTEEHGDNLGFTFTGQYSNGSLAGDLDMGEYRKAKWTAKPHQFGARG
ncbi:MAG TPA: aminotransferase class V-fold PLP-dependent enzyme [Bryobacteraceae bacterium]|nr:aminotransferase class V-fold PLP-dependent enzyme [Bryobacteraceae bacterium]